MGRSPCCSKVGLRRGPWSTKEDTLLTNCIQQNGEGQWRSLPKKAGLLRCGKSCRLRWMNYLRPGIKRGNISQDEEDLIVRLHGLLGNRWSLIAGRLPGRTDNEIKNYWNTHLFKKLKTAGFEPRLHKDLPKPEKPSATGKKKRKQKMTAEEESKREVAEEPPEKTIVYLPKPIRVSPALPRAESYESLSSGTSSSDAGEKAAAEVASYSPMVTWPPSIFDLCDCGGGGGGGGEDDFLDGAYVLPVLHQTDSISSDVDMLEKVYDEYLQLLQEN